jgi:beta-N-acetylhexosaminidase
MGAVAGTVGLGEGAVLALLAGVDALCLGGDFAGESVAETARDALVAAVRSGRLPESRLAEAAGRTAALGARPPVAAAGDLAALGTAAARRALRVVGHVRLAAAPTLVELDPAPTIAVGRTAWGLAGLLPGALEWRLGPDDPVTPLPADRPLVVVARDATRIGWVGRAVAALLAARPDAVVVEMGLPGPVPASRGWIATGGASRASALAAAEALTGTAQ